MKKGKKLLALLMVAMLAVSAASCSSNETTSSSESSGTDSSAAASTDGEEKLDVTLSYMASQDWVQDAEMELGEKFAEETGIKIDYQIVRFRPIQQPADDQTEYRRVHRYVRFSER